MSEYNRYTTQKGQLLLNIKPPSKANQSNTTPQSPPINVYPNNSRNIPYTTVNRSYNNPPSYQINGYTVSYENPIIQPNGASRYINSVKDQNVRYYNPIANQLYPINAYTGQNPYSVLPEQFSRPSPVTKIVDQPKQNGNNYDYIGQADSDNSEKRGNRQNIQDRQNRNSDPICCFPGYWLVCLLLTVVTLSFFLILLKFHQDSIANNTKSNIINGTNTNSTTNNSQSSSPSSTVDTVDNKNQPNTSYKFGPSSYFEPIYVPPINPIDQGPSSSIISTTTTQATTNTNNIIYIEPVPVNGHKLGKIQNLRHRELLS